MPEELTPSDIATVLRRLRKGDKALLDKKKALADLGYGSVKNVKEELKKAKPNYSILSEGISVPGLTSLVLMRQMNVIEMCQSVGRVLRLHLDDVRRIQQGQLTPGKLEDYKKSFGLVHVPVYSNVGISTVKRLQDVVNTVFVEGKPAISTVKR